MKPIVTLSALVLAACWSARAAAQTAGQVTGGAKPKDPLPAWAQTFEEFLTWDVFDIPVWRITGFVLIALIGLTLKNGLIERMLRPVVKLLDRTETELDNALLDAVRRPGGWLVFMIALHFAFEVLKLPESLAAVVGLLLQTVGVAIVAWMLFLAIDVAGIALQKFVEQTESDIDDHIVPLVKRLLRFVLICFAGVIIVQQWGYDVTSLVAGLGVGGIAFALAAQDTLSNWFGSLMIFTDRPFRLGDWVKSGSIEGVVEEVGMRSTKVRTFDRSLITIPNKKIANEPIENFSMRTTRRVKLSIGLEYRTTRAQMEDVLTRVEALLRGHELVIDDTISVVFAGFGASSLDLSVIAFLDTAAWAEFAPGRQGLLLDIMQIVEEAGTAFAFPSQSLYFETPVPAHPTA